TRDGMALGFYNTPEAPVECALEVSSAATERPELKLRMGIHSGAVSGVVDVSGGSNVAGAGINMAQRVMDCGDAGHILVSKHLAEDLEQYGHWKRHLHDLGELEIKHGVRLSVVNLYTEDHGNPELPQKFVQVRNKPSAPLVGEKKRSGVMIAIAGVVLAALIIGGLLLTRNRAPSAPNGAKSEVGRLGETSLPVPNKSVAVLPFENLSENKENAFFADGVQDEILTNLAKVADLKVISRTSVNGYRDSRGRNLRKIGEELAVAHVVEGSVQRAGNRVRG